MRRLAAFFALAACAALPLRADEATRDRVSRYFTGWYSVCPGTKVAVTDAAEVQVPGYEAYRTERTCGLKNRDESGVTLVSRDGKQIFVGAVLHDDSRHDRPFSPPADLPGVRDALQGMFGLPVALSIGAGVYGALVPLDIRIQQVPGASATLPGFVSQDGASILLGEFLPFDVEPAVSRERILAGPAEPRAKKEKAATFTVSAFIDLQCEKCRVRTPQVREVVRARGGAFDIRFLPLVKVHDWAFAAAESGAALANVSPALYAKYEDALFPRAAGMNEKGARDLATDIAEAAGAREAFAAELSSGRARERVLNDINTALKLGLNGTPVFFFRGAWLTSEPDLAENYIKAALGDAGEAGRQGRAALTYRLGRRGGRPAATLALAALIASLSCGKAPEGSGPAASRSATPAAPARASEAVEAADVATRAGRPRGGRTPVIWLGLDALDWELLDRLVAEGRMPNWKRLVAEGSTARLASYIPTLSPLVWTTIATGVGPEVHGIVDFQEVDPATGQKVPISGFSRAVPAIWNVATASGLSVGVVGWWGTHPAEEVKGFFVSDHANPILFEGLPRAGVVYPASLSAGVEQILARDGEVNDRDLAPYLHMSDAEIRRARESGKGLENPVAALARILGATRAQQRIARELYDRNQPDLMMLYLEGTDAIGHVFGSYTPPRMSIVSEEDFARYSGAVDEYYAMIDRILGQWMRRADEDGATLVVNSDHGFRWGAERPTELSSLESHPALWHRRDGVLAVRGVRVAASPERRSASVFDVAPTISALLGLPVDRRTEGKVFGAGFRGLGVPERKNLFGTIAVRRLAPEAVSESASNEYAARLRALGYLSGGEPTKLDAPGGDRPGVTEKGWQNLGIYLLNTKKDLAGAEAAFRKVLAIQPAYVAPQIALAKVYRERGDDAGAIEWLLSACKAGYPDPEGTLLQWYVDYDERGKHSQARRVLEKGVSTYPASEALSRELGLVHYRARRCAQAWDAVARFEAETRTPETLNVLALFKACLGRKDDAIAYFERSLAINADQPAVIRSLAALRKS